MTLLKVLLVDDNMVALQSLAEYLKAKEDIEVVGAAGNGNAALEILRKETVDVMVLDLVMPQLDGLGVLEQMLEMDLPKRPGVIMFTSVSNDEIIARAMSMGANYYMIKPCDYDVLYQRIGSVVHRNLKTYTAVLPKQRINSFKSLDERIGGMFLTIGIPAHIKGYQFLREAVKLVVDNPDMINRITKELYPAIAKRFDTSASKVERAIRHAIEVAWNRGRTDIINEMFGHCVYTPNDKPTNGEFIALIADKIAIERAG